MENEVAAYPLESGVGDGIEPTSEAWQASVLRLRHSSK